MFGFLAPIIGAISNLLPSIIKIVGTGIERFANALTAFFKVLGALEPEEDAKQLGDKALQAEELKPEQFDTYEQYLKEVEAYELDIEKSKLSTDEQKLEKGIELMTGLALERYGDLMEQFLIIMANKNEYFNERRMEAFAEIVKDDQDAIGKVVGYIEGHEKNTDKNDEGFDALVTVEKNVSPDTPESEVWKKIIDLRDLKEPKD